MQHTRSAPSPSSTAADVQRSLAEVHAVRLATAAAGCVVLSGGERRHDHVDVSGRAHVGYVALYRVVHWATRRELVFGSAEELSVWLHDAQDVLMDLQPRRRAPVAPPRVIEADPAPPAPPPADPITGQGTLF